MTNLAVDVAVRQDEAEVYRLRELDLRLGHQLLNRRRPQMLEARPLILWQHVPIAA